MLVSFRSRLVSLGAAPLFWKKGHTRQVFMKDDQPHEAMITAEFLGLLELLIQALRSAQYLLALNKTKYGLKAHLGKRMAQKVTMV